MNPLLILGYTSACIAGFFCLVCVGIKVYEEVQNTRRLTIAQQLQSPALISLDYSQTL